MAGRNTLADMLKRYSYTIGLAGLQRFWKFMAVPMSKIQEAISDTRRGAIRGNGIEAAPRSLRRPGRSHVELQDVLSEDFYRLRKRLRLENQAAGVLGPLIRRLIARYAVRAPPAAEKTDAQRRCDR